VDNAVALPTAPTFAHKLHSLTPPMFMNEKSGTAGFYGGDKCSDAGGCCWGTRSSSRRCDTSASRSMTPWRYLSRPRFDPSADAPPLRGGGRTSGVRKSDRLTLSARNGRSPTAASGQLTLV
jgi:hypothetical protein